MFDCAHFVQLPRGQPYPDVLQTELAARYRPQSPTVSNGGHAGESLSDDLSTDCRGGNPNQSIPFQRHTSAISSGQYNALLLMEGCNDVDGAVGDSCRLGKAISVLRTIIDDATARGVRVILGTILPMVPIILSLLRDATPSLDSSTAPSEWVGLRPRA